MTFKPPLDFSEMMKMFDPEQITKLFDPEQMKTAFEPPKALGVDLHAMIESNRKNFEAMLAANKSAAAGYKDFYQKQMAIFDELTKYAKENPAFSFRAALVEGRVVSVEELQALAALPTQEELFSKLLGLLQAPAQRLASVVSAPGRQLAIVLGQAEKEKKFSQAS